MKKYLTRRGDGALIEMSSDELMRDFEEGTQDAADRGKIAPLSKDDLERLMDRQNQLIQTVTLFWNQRT